MATILRHSDTCDVVNVSKHMVVEAVIQDFRDKEMVTVVLNKSVKVLMNWNGRMYEGRMAGMDVTSDGPKGQKYSEGR